MTPSPPLRFTFGLHLHQPVGNYDSVFEEHVAEVYLPFLRRLVERGTFPVALHLSGPLLEWLEAHDARYLDLLGPLVADGRVELLLAGFYEPVLAVLPREDRLEQIRWMREALARRFGVDPRGLWLTERVWEPGLAADLADAGVRFALVDDHHFAVAGFPAERLHAPYWTESGGRRVALFPIDQRLRYLIPFHSPGETADYLRGLRAAGHRLAVLADDGEKFGGWPGTRERVYGAGWLDQFIDTLESLADSGEVVLSTFADALAAVPSGGLAYLPTASYREMEAWTLPSDAAVRLERLERDLGAERVAGPDGALVRGGHWRNFQVKYAESNRLHKKMLALSALCRERGDPPAARRAVGRGQCNDAYWHGVFGGLYLPHLRQGVWRELARAESILRAGESLAYEVRDVDCDGRDEVWVHSSHFSAIVSPARGGAVEELTLLESGVNYADTLTRRREAYHQIGESGVGSGEARIRESGVGSGESRLRESGVGSGESTASGGSDAGDSPLPTPHSPAPSIHDIEHSLRLDVLPPVDLDPRALFVDRVLAPDVTRDAYERADYRPLATWAGTALAFSVAFTVELVREGTERGIEIALMAEGGGMEKRIRFTERGEVTVAWRWRADALPRGAFFAPEISLAAPAAVHADGATETWRFPIETVAKSERGLERTVQGESVTPRWPVDAGAATVRLVPPHAATTDTAATAAPATQPAAAR